MVCEVGPTAKAKKEKGEVRRGETSEGSGDVHKQSIFLPFFGGASI